MTSATSPRRTLRIAMNGVTGRMGYRQHLLRSILPLRDAGLVLEDGTRVAVEPILVGRNADKIADLISRINDGALKQLFLWDLAEEMIHRLLSTPEGKPGYLLLPEFVRLCL